MSNVIDSSIRVTGRRRLRRIVVGLTTLLFALIAGGSAGAPQVSAAPDADERVVTLTLFHGEGCPHCARAREFLAELAVTYPDLVIDEYEVWYSSANQALFDDMMAALGETPRAVPTIIVDDRVWVGFSDAIGAEIDGVVDALLAGTAVPQSDAVIVEVPIVGDVDVGDRSLVVATLVIGFVDGVNPCSLWVLSVLLALVLHSGSRGRVLLVGTLFLAITSALYGLYMVGAYSALEYAGDAAWIRAVVAAVAGVFGVFHLKEFVTTRGPSLTIPAGRKPGLYQRMRELARAESLSAALAGTAVLAVGVSLLETPCTAGLPLLWTDLLASSDVGAGQAVVLFAIYLSVFLLDELLIFGAAVVFMRAAKLQEQHGRVLQLLSGTLMVTLALTMLIRPELLESITGVVWVFAAAGLLVVVFLLIDQVVHLDGRRTDRTA